MTQSDDSADDAQITASLIAAAGLFDAEWYLRTSPDVAASGMDPLLHYIGYGEAEGRRPCAGFDPVWYRAFQRLAPGCSPLRHFLRRAPSAGSFDAGWYAVRYADVTAAGLDPFTHYVLNGAAEGRLPLPPEAVAVIAASGLFEESQYLIAGPDLLGTNWTPLHHYCAAGWREGRRPNPYFDPLWYRRIYLSAAADDADPLAHYITQGERAGMRPIVYFDPAWYRRTYALAPAESPLRHWLLQRRTQRFSPTPLFDVAFYCRTYAALIGPNRDPFAHFLLHGTMRDLSPSAAFDAAAWRAQHMGPLALDATRPGEVERQNPLVHHLLAGFTPPAGDGAAPPVSP